ncbi:tripartite tricarboxylate transporter TctB family protein [Evansella halocellulosilytica]|uniref:tripartite tricarboxylate transporter TctB family protein n=1 Tax=Evansella halocellulosilytica TaxID=2011013 RepID=UPI0015CDEEEF|nr:tripartite tricarboxylate transporter TctB family protein [Evansella halocellulosilytica]
MFKQYKDTYSSTFLLILSFIMFVATFYFQRLTVSNVGAEFVPRLVAIGIFFLSVLLLINAIRRVRNPDKHPDIEEEDDQEKNDTPASPLSVVTTIGLLIGYLILMPTVGFLIMTTIYLFFQMYLLAAKAQRNVALFLIVSVISSSAIYYCFKSIFYLRLPSGILG